MTERAFFLLILLFAEIGGICGFLYPERFNTEYPLVLGAGLGATLPLLCISFIGLICAVMGWEDEATLRLRDLRARSGHWL